MLGGHVNDINGRGSRLPAGNAEGEEVHAALARALVGRVEPPDAQDEADAVVCHYQTCLCRS